MEKEDHKSEKIQAFSFTVVGVPCAACGEAVGEEELFCPACGALTREAPSGEIMPVEEEREAAPVTVAKKKTTFFLLAAVGALLLGGIVLLLWEGLREKQYAVFAQNGQWTVRELTSGRTWEPELGEGTALWAEMDRDRKRLLLSQGEEGNYRLYLWTEKNKAGILLAENVLRHVTTENLNTVVYQMQDESLCLYDGEEGRSLLELPVETFSLSEDGSCVAMLTRGRELYVYHGGALHLAKKDVRALCGIPAASGAVYYRTQEGYYRYGSREGNLQVASASSTLLTVSGDSMYYTLTEASDLAHLPLALYITDSLKESDEQMVMPMPSDYKLSMDYRQAMEIYNQRLSRDHIRQSLEYAELVGMPLTTLYYFDGSKSAAVANMVGTVQQLSENVLVIHTYDASGIEKQDVKDILSVSKLRQDVLSALQGSITRFLVKDGVLTQIRAAGAHSYCLSPREDMLYYWIGSESENMRLCGISFTNGEPGESLLYDSAVLTGGMYLEDGRFLYARREGLFLQGVQLPDSQNVVWDMEKISCRDGKILFFTDEKNGYATLKCWQKGETTLVATDVPYVSGAARLLPGGRIWFVQGNSLWEYHEEQVRLVSQGVSKLP